MLPIDPMILTPAPVLRVALTPDEVGSILDDPDRCREHLADVVQPTLETMDRLDNDTLAAACSLAFVLGDCDEVPRLQELLDAQVFVAVVVSLPHLQVAGVAFDMDNKEFLLRFDFTPPALPHCGIFRAP